MSLSKFLHWLHEEKCSFRIPSSEVSDIESSVYECLSAILQKGQSLIVTPDREDEVKTYRELFSVEEILPVEVFLRKLKLFFPMSSTLTSSWMLEKLIYTLGVDLGVYRSHLKAAGKNGLNALANCFVRWLKKRWKQWPAMRKTYNGIRALCVVLQTMQGSHKLNLNSSGRGKTLNLTSTLTSWHQFLALTSLLQNLKRMIIFHQISTS